MKNFTTCKEQYVCHLFVMFSLRVFAVFFCLFLFVGFFLVKFCGSQSREFKVTTNFRVLNCNGKSVQGEVCQPQNYYL